MNVMEILASILNPNPGQQVPNRLTQSPRMDANYLAQPSAAMAAPMGAPAPAMATQQPASNGGPAASRGYEGPITRAGGYPEGTLIPSRNSGQSPVYTGGNRPAQAAGGGSFLQNLFDPEAKARNATMNWLVNEKGYDENAASVIVRDKQFLQEILRDHARGGDPKTALEIEKLQLEVQEKRNPAPSFSDQIAAARLEFDRSNAELTTDIREYQYDVKHSGFEGTLTEHIEAKAASGSDWSKLDDDTLFHQRTGETRELGKPGSGDFRFEGTSVEAQSLNGLMESGQLTAEQAQQLGAGKTITNPADGSMMFLTPQGVFGQSAGGNPQPIQPGGQPSPVPSRLLSPESLGSSPTQARPGVIQITPGKASMPTETQRNRKASVDQAFSALNTELDRYAELVGQYGIEAMPGKGKDQLNAVRQGVMLQMKELFNLGVLNGPDLSLMERMIFDPTLDVGKEGGWANVPDQIWTGAFGGAKGRADSSVAELKRMLGSIRDSVHGSTGDNSADVPAGAIDMLRQNPLLAPRFDEKYGAGSAARILGGQ
jgi:hypothetical protein